MNIDYYQLPEHMQDGLRDYVNLGVHPGRFLGLILCNDFVRAAGHADDINKHALMDYARILYCDLPAACWGSQENIDVWMKHDGMKGLQSYLDVQRGQSNLVQN